MFKCKHSKEKIKYGEMVFSEAFQPPFASFKLPFKALRSLENRVIKRLETKLSAGPKARQIQKTSRGDVKPTFIMKEIPDTLSHVIVVQK